MKTAIKGNLTVATETLDKVLTAIQVWEESKYGKKQLPIQLLPHISNALYHRGNELVEAERFKTIIALARALDDDNMQKALIGLKYKLTIED